MSVTYQELIKDLIDGCFVLSFQIGFAR